MKITIKTTLADLYLEYVNDFLTVSRFAEYHEITEREALTLINLGRQYHEERVSK